MTYTYQPKINSSAGSLNVPNPVVYRGPYETAEMLGRVAEDLCCVGLSPITLPIDEEAYRQYLVSAQYRADYYSDNRPEKSLEHFLSLQMLRLAKGNVFIDVAAEYSELPEIIVRTVGCAAFAQDIMYAPIIDENRIGGDACAMPVPDGFATSATLTCSLEHFEGDADMRLFRELARVIRPGGRVVVVPLYLLDHPGVLTDPRYANAAGVVFDPEATVYALEGWGNRHGRFYSPATLIERIVDRTPEFRFTVYRLSGQQAIHASIYAKWLLLAERI